MVSYDLSQYTGPLDLLDHLIQERRDDLFDLPIAEISAAYLEILQASSRQGLDMDLASEYIVMAASLMEIKSRMLLPQERVGNREAVDPRQDLVLQLMAYRRMKALALNLESRHAEYAWSLTREPLSPQELELDAQPAAQSLEPDKFIQARTDLIARNQERFNRQNMRIHRLLQRERFSIKDCVKMIGLRLRQGGKHLFSQIFPQGQVARGQLVSGFLALLEMVNQHQVEAEQSKPFDDIAIYRRKERKELS